MKNTVAAKNIQVIDLATWIPSADEIVTLDIAQFLYKGLIVKEDEFRKSIQEFCWEIYQSKYVQIICSTQAIIPTWSYMLLQEPLLNVAQYCAIASSQNQFIEGLLLHRIHTLNTDAYNSQRVVVKGCGDKRISENIYAQLSCVLIPIVRTLSYGEPCSMVPVYKKKLD